MRLLITGGAGCLGASLVDAYLPRGVAILVIDNFATGGRDALPEAAGLDIVAGSIADRDFVAAAIGDFAPTHVIHAAASYKDPDDWGQDIATNVAGTVHVVEAAKRAGVRRFINLQTALCYGRPERVPIPVDHPTRPVTSYGISKTAGEAYVALSGLGFVSLRLANIMAPRLAIGPAPTFYKRLKAGQSCFCTDAVRDFLDITDFLALIALALDDDAPSGIFNVSTGQGNTIADVFAAVAAHLGTAAEAPVVPVAADDIGTVVLDPSRTERAFGWTARIGFAETMRRMLDWYDAHGVGAVHSHLRVPAR